MYYFFKHSCNIIIFSNKHSDVQFITFQVEPFLITDDEFEKFVERHKKMVPDLVVPESNEAMRNSYIILDEYMR